MKSSKTVIDQTCSAYIDSNPKLDWGTASRLRNLSFRASQPVSVAEAVKIMTKALHLKSASEQGYNNFAPALLKKLPLGSEVTLAREGSVCVYVKLPEGVEVDLESMRVKLDADECDMEGGEVRVWWD